MEGEGRGEGAFGTPSVPGHPACPPGRAGTAGRAQGWAAAGGRSWAAQRLPWGEEGPRGAKEPPVLWSPLGDPGENGPWPSGRRPPQALNKVPALPWPRAGHLPLHVPVEDLAPGDVHAVPGHRQLELVQVVLRLLAVAPAGCGQAGRVRAAGPPWALLSPLRPRKTARGVHRCPSPEPRRSLAGRPPGAQDWLPASAQARAHLQ